MLQSNIFSCFVCEEAKLQSIRALKLSNIGNISHETDGSVFKEVSWLGIAGRIGEGGRGWRVEVQLSGAGM